MLIANYLDWIHQKHPHGFRQLIHMIGKPYRKQADISHYGSYISTDPHSIKQSSFHGNLLVLLICVFLYTVVISLTARNTDPHKIALLSCSKLSANNFSPSNFFLFNKISLSGKLIFLLNCDYKFLSTSAVCLQLRNVDK